MDNLLNNPKHNHAMVLNNGHKIVKHLHHNLTL